MGKAAAIKNALAKNAGDLARLLLGPENRSISSKIEMRFGRKGSLSVVTDGPKKGQWYDHEAGTGGDLLSLIQRERSCGFAEATAFAAEYVGGHHVRSEAPPLRFSHQFVGAFDAAAHDARRLKAARDIWRNSISLHGTVAERYLISRGIDHLPNAIHDVLRFHPAGIYGATRHPMLIGLYRDIVTNEPCGVHRTALSATGTKIGRKYLGRKAGAAIKLTADEEVTQGLTIGEGIETTLSGMILGLAPAWALGDAGELGRFPVLPGIGAITILVDHDESGAGQTQSAKCRDRWLAANREVLTVIPDRVGEDINDLVRASK